MGVVAVRDVALPSGCATSAVSWWVLLLSSFLGYGCSSLSKWSLTWHTQMGVPRQWASSSPLAVPGLLAFVVEKLVVDMADPDGCARSVWWSVLLSPSARLVSLAVS